MRNCIHLTVIVVVAFSGAIAAAQSQNVPPPDAPKPTGIEGLTPDRELRGKTSLVRGTLKRLDPIHDELLVHAFGGGDVHIAFDTRTELVHGDARTQVASIPAGSIVSVDTVIDNGKLFARTVRISTLTAGEISGQVVRYDAAKSRLIVHDPTSPENINLRVTSATSVMNHDQRATLDSLTPGSLVHVNFVPGDNSATLVEILAKRGSTFTFAGKIVAVDLRTRTVALTNTSDQSVRELAVNTLDSSSLRLLREGANVSIEAEFDGDRYNARSVTVIPQTP